VDLNIFFYAVIRRWFEMCNSANVKYAVTEEELEYEGYPKHQSRHSIKGPPLPEA